MTHHITQLRKVKNLTLSRLQTVRHTRSVPKGDYPVGKVDGDGHLESSDPIKGKVDKPRSIITYVYKEVKGDVYVHYKDTEGNTIKTSVVDEKDQPVDKDYDTVVDNRPNEINTMVRHMNWYQPVTTL